MQQIMETYGRAVLLLLVLSALMGLLFYNLSKGNTLGILSLVGEAETSSTESLAFDEYLSLDETELKVVGKIYSGKKVLVSDHLVTDKDVDDLRVVDVEETSSGEKYLSCIKDKGSALYFEKRGMYRITVSLTDARGVCSKRHFYIYVK